MENNIPNPKEKQNKIFNIVLIALIIFSGIYFIWNNFMGVQPDIKINGTQISMSDSLQDILDAGFVLCSEDGRISDYAESTLPVPGKQVDNFGYYIGIPQEGDDFYCYCSGIKITLANFSSSKSPVGDCAIYKMDYYPGEQSYAVDILVNGKDMKNADIDAWADFFEETGYPFTKEDLDKFRSGDKDSLGETKGRYKFEVLSGIKSIIHLSFTRNVKVTYQ